MLHGSFWRPVFWLLQAFAGIAALTWALRGLDTAVLGEVISAYPAWAVPVLMGFVCLDYMVMCCRLRRLLPVQTSLRQGMEAVVLCCGYNNLLPAKAGDVIKLAWLTRQLKSGVLPIASAVAWERLLDVAALAGVCLLASGLTGRIPSTLLPLLFCAGCIAFVVLRRWSAVFHRGYERYLPKHVAQALGKLHTDLIDTLAWRQLAVGLTLTLLTWGCYFGSFAVALRCVAGFSLSVPQLLAVFATTCVGMAVPSLPGGLGVFEGSMVLSLGWYGVEHASALGAALLLHACYFIPVSLVAIVITVFGTSLSMQGICKTAYILHIFRKK